MPCLRCWSPNLLTKCNTYALFYTRFNLDVASFVTSRNSHYVSMMSSRDCSVFQNFVSKLKCRVWVGGSVLGGFTDHSGVLVKLINRWGANCQPIIFMNPYECITGRLSYASTSKTVWKKEVMNSLVACNHGGWMTNCCVCRYLLLSWFYARMMMACHQWLNEQRHYYGQKNKEAFFELGKRFMCNCTSQCPALMNTAFFLDCMFLNPDSLEYNVSIMLSCPPTTTIPDCQYHNTNAKCFYVTLGQLWYTRGTESGRARWVMEKMGWQLWLRFLGQPSPPIRFLHMMAPVVQWANSTAAATALPLQSYTPPCCPLYVFHFF